MSIESFCEINRLQMLKDNSGGKTTSRKRFWQCEKPLFEGWSHVPKARLCRALTAAAFIIALLYLYKFSIVRFNLDNSRIDYSFEVRIFQDLDTVPFIEDSLELNWGDAVDLSKDGLVKYFNQRAGLSVELQRELDGAIMFRETLRKYITERNGSESIRVKVMGQKPFYVQRDLKMIQKGYARAMSGFNFITIPETEAIEVSQDPNKFDAILCISVQTCAPPQDIFIEAFKQNPGLRVNRIPALREVLWSKQNFCKTIPSWLAVEVSFACWIIPDQTDQLMRYVSNRPPSDKWIVKPWIGGSGMGITVATGANELKDKLEKNANFVVQPFLGNPLLVKSRKNDLRVYVLVTSTYPLRAYVHEKGLVRFAAHPYKAKSSTDKIARTQFLTNTGANKGETNMTAAELTWSFQRFYEAIGTERARKTRLGIDRAVALVLLAAESRFPRNTGCDTADGACYHLLGFDVILTANSILPRVIEVNGQPSFAWADTSSVADVSHYNEAKLAVARDTAKIVFSQMTPHSKQQARQLVHRINEPGFVQYALELTREQQVTTEFRPSYPSPIASLYKGADDSFTRLLEGDEKRLHLHRTLNLWEQMRLVHCHESKECNGGLKSVLSDLIEEGNSIPRRFR